MTLCRGESLLKFTTSVLCKQRCYNSYLQLGWDRGCEHLSEQPDEKKNKNIKIKFECREKLEAGLQHRCTRNTWVKGAIDFFFLLDHQHSELISYQ